MKNYRYHYLNLYFDSDRHLLLQQLLEFDHRISLENTTDRKYDEFKKDDNPLHDPIKFCKYSFTEHLLKSYYGTDNEREFSDEEKRNIYLELKYLDSCPSYRKVPINSNPNILQIKHDYE